MNIYGVRHPKIYKALVEPHELDGAIQQLSNQRYQVLSWTEREGMIHILYKKYVIWPLSQSWG
jgi:hypothetical protein